MRDYPRRILALLVVMVRVIGLFPTTINAASGHEENATDEVRAFTADDKAAERPESQVPGTLQRDGETPAVVTFISSGTLIDTVKAPFVTEPEQ